MDLQAQNKVETTFPYFRIVSNKAQINDFIQLQDRQS